ncbi:MULTISPECIES: hypothetical protein [unclassified Phaeobacter]|uniref:hypothetical protein n=1 Tax=unclassified Phaeobacter TaxID=2621772 RepID=UPI003A83E361
MADAPMIDPPTSRRAVIPAYRYSRAARSPRLLLALGLWGAGIAALSLALSVALWISLLLILPMLPGLWELWRNPTASLKLDATRLCWRNASGAVDLPINRISHVTLDRRWDFSHRATIHTEAGKRLRIPPDCLPPHQILEQALTAAGLPVRRHHFRVY